MFKSSLREWQTEKPITKKSGSDKTCKNKLQNPKERRKYGEPLEREPQRDEASRGIKSKQPVETGHKYLKELQK